MSPSRLSPRGSRLAAATALTTALLLIAACGGGSVAQTEDGRTRLRVVVGPVSFEHVYIAQDQGFFDEQQLAVEVSTGSTADAQIPLLLNGQADIAMSAGVAMVTAAARDLPVGIICGANNAVPPITSGLVVPQDSPIRSTGDLAGTTIGIAGLQSTTQLSTMMSAQANGVDPASITFVEVPLPSMTESMQDGTIDAAYVIGPFFSVGEGTGFRLVESPVLQHLANGPNVIFAAADQFIAENNDVLRRFIDAIGAATDYANANPEAIREMDRQHTEQDPEYIANRPLAPFTTEVDRAAVQTTIDAMVEHGFIDTKPELSEVVADIAPGQ